MPCDAVRIISLELQAANRDVLRRGLEAAGWTVALAEAGGAMYLRKGWQTAVIRDGQIEAGEDVATRIAGEVKLAYSQEAVRTAARRYGWSVVADKLDTTHYQIIKR
jgi:predicted mannosyl-3-phosphoglycerate phosphatase (HAD superfamily)